MLATTQITLFIATFIIEVEDRKVRFVRNLLKHFSFVSIRESQPEEDTDEEIVANIRQGLKELRLVEQGKMKVTPFKDFLKELDEV